ncbi:formyl transferase [Muriicola marianensis]|uniref:formyl transferase n=1 Tax=Muriicola marianensis TaxID=1324801 RepID=UPI0016675ECB|nr:formyl transferase [Muriicola marianensis]
MFRILIVPLLNIETRERVKDIIKNNQLNKDDFKKEHLIRVPSVNSEECINLLKEIQPKVVVVQGTRIISKKVLNCIDATFINTHAGITPLYRGIHGAYWSKINKDGHCGVSVHLVDPGIDTGGILYQENIETIPQDNFISYTYLQLAKGIELMKLAIQDALNDDLKVITNDLASKFRTHPTIWFYIRNRIFKGVK